MRRGRAVLLLSLILPLLFSGCVFFGPRYTLTLSVNDNTGGSLRCEPLFADYTENTVVNLTAVPDSGWEISGWSGVTTSDDTSATVLMDANRSVTVQFRPKLSRNNPTDGVNVPQAVGFSPSAPDDKWTFMVYLDGDNNLEDYALLDFNEMEAGLKASGNSENINIIVLFDRRNDGTSDTGWTETRTYRIAADDSADIISDQLATGFEAELNMGDPATLTDFLNFCQTEAPADHYALMFWNHGGGARSVTLPQPEVQSRHICEDESSPGDYLFMDEVQQGIKAAFPVGLDVVSMDACLMGTVEAAYEMRDLCNYYVASMSNVNSHGWNYADFFGRMAAGAGGGTAEDLAGLMVDSYRTFTLNMPAESISSVRTAGLSSLKTKIDLLSAELYSADKKVLIQNIRDNTYDFFEDSYELEAISAPYHDLGDLCYMLISNEAYLSPAVSAAALAVIDELGKTVTAAYAGPSLGNYYGSGLEVKRGLSIFFSKGNLIYKNQSHYAWQYWYTALDSSVFGPYGFIDFCTSDDDGQVETWRELMEAWYDPFRPPVGFTPGSW